LAIGEANDFLDAIETTARDSVLRYEASGREVNEETDMSKRTQKTPPKKRVRNRMVAFWCEEELHQRLESAAAREQRSLSDFVRLMVSAALDLQVSTRKGVRP
jgi:predicted HicB family RNase H-like nuclease